MTEIRFYHLQRQSEAQVLPLLLGKAYEGGRKIVVKLADERSVKQMNEHLWTYAPNSFLPHGSKADGSAEDQPVWLTDADENPNGADVLILGNGVEAENQGDFDLCCEMLDGNNPEAVKAARERWKSYKEKGYNVTYWQQTDRGGWEQKA